MVTHYHKNENQTYVVIRQWLKGFGCSLYKTTLYLAFIIAPLINSTIPSSLSTKLDNISLQESVEIMLLLSLQQIVTIISDMLILSTVEKINKDLAIQTILNHRSTQLITLICSLAMHIGVTLSSIAIIESVSQLTKSENKNKIKHILAFST